MPPVNGLLPPPPDESVHVIPFVDLAIETIPVILAPTATQ